MAENLRLYASYYWNDTTYDATLDLTVMSQSISNNSSIVEYSLNANVPNSDYTFTITIGGKDYTVDAHGTAEIPHKADGTANITVAFNVDFTIQEGYDYFPASMGDNTTFSLDTIARPIIIQEAENFNDEQNPTIHYISYTPTVVSSARVFLQVAGQTIQEGAIGKTTGSYTFNLTQAQREKIWRNMPTSASAPVVFAVETILGGNAYTRVAERTVTLVNAAPIISPIIEDGNNTTNALTGDVNTFIKYYSEAVYSIGASGRKGATIVEQSIKNGNKINTSPLGSFANVEDENFIITATDSRGLTTTVGYQVSMIDYVKPTISATASAPTSVQDMTVDLSGMCFNGSFGAVDNNIKIYYRYTAINYPVGAWIEYKGALPAFNNYSVTITLSDVDYQLGYNFESRIVDSLNDIEGAQITIKTIPVFDWSADDFNFNVPVNMKVGHINYNLYGLCRALTEGYNFTGSVTTGANYSTAAVSATLVGNNLRCRLQATRKSATGAPLVTNEKVCDVIINHGEKINQMLNISFGNGSTGGVASFYTSNVSYTGETVSFSLYLASSAQSDTSFDTFFTIPVTINLDKYT